MMKKMSTLFTGFIVIFGLAAAAYADTQQGDQYKGSLVMFLTQTNGSMAGHGIHIARRMLSESRDTTIILTGEALRLALKKQKTELSPFDNKPLQKELQAFLKEGGQIFYTPPSLKVIDAQPDELIQGVTPPVNHDAFHDHMFEPRTKLMVF